MSDNVIELKQRGAWLIGRVLRLNSIAILSGVGLGRGAVGVDAAVAVARGSDFLGMMSAKRAAVLCAGQAAGGDLQRRVLAATDCAPELDDGKHIAVISNEDPHPNTETWLGLCNEFAAVKLRSGGTGLILLEINDRNDLYNPAVLAELMELRDTTGACVLVSCPAPSDAEALSGLLEGGGALVAEIDVQLAVVEYPTYWGVSFVGDESGVGMPFKLDTVLMAAPVPVSRLKDDW